MNRSTGLIVAIVYVLDGTSVFATNGDVLIGLGAKARGMGGVGIATSHGAESALVNPAMITAVRGTEVSFGGTFFMPDVSYDGGTGYQRSNADLNVIPEVSIANEVDENFFWGIGMWGTAGMGTDYRDVGTASTGGNSTMQMVTNLQLMHFGVPLAYKRAGFSVGITPIMQYGALDIHYKMPTSQPAPGDVNYVGEGAGQDFGFGYNLGLAYDFNKVGIKGLSVGVVYKSAIEMEYDQQLSTATTPFIPLFGSAMSDKLEQPAEMGVGVSYKFMEKHTVAFDYKQIQWEDTDGYGDFQWEDQDVYAIGYEYVESTWAIRIGYNYAENPIQEMSGGGVAVDPADPSTYRYAAGAAMNMFNLLGFPATVESHYTIGGTYIFGNQISVDAAFTYADETKDTYDTSGLAALGMAAPEVSVKHSQTGLSFQLNYNF